MKRAVVWFDNWCWTRKGAELRAQELHGFYPDRDIDIKVDRIKAGPRRWRVRVFIIEEAPCGSKS